MHSHEKVFGCQALYCDYQLYTYPDIHPSGHKILYSVHMYNSTLWENPFNGPAGVVRSQARQVSLHEKLRRKEIRCSEYNRYT